MSPLRDVVVTAAQQSRRVARAVLRRPYRAVRKVVDLGLRVLERCVIRILLAPLYDRIDRLESKLESYQETMHETDRMILAFLKSVSFTPGEPTSARDESPHVHRYPRSAG